MNIAGLSVKHPVTIIVIYALALGIAFTMIPNLAVDLYPATTRPVISVYTHFAGAGPADVEKNVTEVLERSLASSRRLVNMTSNSQFERSNINLEFSYGTDMDKAASDAQNLVNRLINNLPTGVDAPVVRRFDMSALPIMRLVLRGNYPPDQLRVFAEDEIQSSIQRIDGVASADIYGGPTQIVKVAVSLNRLAAFNLTLNDVTTSLKGQNVLSSGGNLRQGTREYQIMTQEELVDVDQIKRLVIKTVSTVGAGSLNRSQVVRLEDIADVSLGYSANATRVDVNDQSGVYIQVTSESDSNQVQVADRVKAALDDINATLPRGITLGVLTDNTTMIKATLSQVYANAYQGAILTMLILFLFLRNIRGTLIIGLSIPISLLLTIMCMTIFGFTLNLLTMTGLIMGLGMTIDGSVVIIDNVYSYRMRGAKPDIAAILGSREMLLPILASTNTTLCVFIPLIIYKNDLKDMGQLFSDLIFTVVISLICSLIVSVTLVPSLCGSILKLNSRKQKPLKNRVLRTLDNGGERILVGLENFYKKALGYCLSHRVLMIVLVFSLLLFSLLQFTSIGMNMYFRSRTDDIVSINVAMPQGTAIDVTENTLFQVENLIKQNVKGYRNIVLTAQLTGTNQGSIQITLPEPAQQIDTPDSIIRKLTPLTNVMAGMQVSYRAGRSMGNTSAVEITVSSNDYDAIIATSNDILHIMRQYLPEIENPAVNIDEGAPQLIVQIDRDRAAAMGISVATIASEISTAMNGTAATTMSRGNRLLDVTVMLRDEDQMGTPNLDAVFVTSRTGDRISLSNLATIVESRAPSSIRRENQERVVRITGDLAGRIAVTDMQRRLEATVSENLVPREGVTVSYQGEAADITTYTAPFIMIIAIAIFLVLGVMASQFESFIDPFIIFFCVPLLFIGVIWIYKFSNQPMTMFSIVGIVALVGVVVNNGIILVDYTNTLRARGMKVREACMEAGRRRLRPILITSLTTIIGMFPLAFFPGAGADTIQPIAKTFVGGLTVSTFMTLFLIPSIYSLLNSRHDKKKAKEEARRALANNQAELPPTP